MAPSPADLLNRVTSFARNHDLLDSGCCVIVAVSGGPDSVALLDLLHRVSQTASLQLHVAHLNHQLRPSASDDAQHVQTLSNQYQLPVHIGQADVHLRAKNEKRSLEDAARQARREFLDAIKEKVGASHIALGHTRSDQAETLLFRLMRGAGLEGLGGMRPKTDDGRIRPLLAMSRVEIEAYVHMRQLPVCQDESNTDLRFARNRIRHALLPQIKETYSPQIEAILARTAELLQTDHDYLEEQTQKAFSQVVQYRAKRKIILDVKHFFGYHVSLRRRLIRMALFELYAPPDATAFNPVNRVLQTITQDASKTHIIDDLFAQRVGDFCFLTRATPPYRIPICINKQISMPDMAAQLTTRILSVETMPNAHLCVDKYTVYFDLDGLPAGLYLRPPRPGDRIRPFGFDGHRKLSTLLIDSKIPYPLRDEQPLVVGSDNTVLWAIGLRRASTAPVTPSTRRVLEMVFQGGWQHLFAHPEKRIS